MGAFEFLGSVGAILFFVFAVLAVLIPVWLYLINVYTYQTRNELRKLNKQVVHLVDAIEKQNASPEAIETTGAMETRCGNCGKRFKHSAGLSGSVKDCPRCNKPILLN